MARKSNGWIKVHSSLLKEELTPSQFKFWVSSLLLANPLTANDSGIVDMSMRQLAQALNMSRSEVWRREQELVAKDMVTLLPKGFLINKYKHYQGKAGTVPWAGQLRDTGATCWVCTEPELLPPIAEYEAWLDARFEEHHIVPLVLGGPNTKENKVILCKLCHKQAANHMLLVKRELSEEAATRLKFLQEKSVPPTGQTGPEAGVPPVNFFVPPTGQFQKSVPPTGLNVPDDEAVSPPKKKEDSTKKIKKGQGPEMAPDPLNEERKKVFEGLKERRAYDKGYTSPNPGAEAKAITWMLKQGYTAEEILAAHDKMKKQKFWADKMLSMQSVKAQIGELAKKGAGYGESKLKYPPIEG